MVENGVYEFSSKGRLIIRKLLSAIELIPCKKEGRKEGLEQSLNSYYHCECVVTVIIWLSLKDFKNLPQLFIA